MNSNTSSIPPVVPPFGQSTPTHGPRLFDLFMEDDELVHVVGTNRGRERDLLYPSIVFDQALKWVRSDL